MSPAEILARLPDVSIGLIDTVERIKHGLTNESWLVHSDAGVFVVRLSNTAEVSLQIDRRSEALILEAVAHLGIGPEVICCDPERHLLVTRHAGPTWTPSQVIEPGNIERVAAVLRRLHGMQPPAGVQVVDLAAVARGYLETLDEHGVACAAGVPELRKRAALIAGLLHVEATLRLCHNDVHALNIVDDGTLRLIDWEYGGIGERLFDLASLCVYHEFSKTQRMRLLDSYLVEPDATAWHRLELCVWLFDYIRDLWTAVRELPEGVDKALDARP